MKKSITIATAITIALASIPTTAQAMPTRYRNSDTTTVNGTHYIITGKQAIIDKLANRRTVTVPKTIKHNGRRYSVRAIWDGAIRKTTKSIKLDADLDTLEDVNVWSRRVSVKTSDKSTYKWLHDGGAKVTYCK